jgi:predicted aspartyl protease
MRAEDCSVAQPHPLTPAEIALINGNTVEAESIYRQEIAKNPKDPELTAGLTRTLLAEQKVDDAATTVKAALVPDPQSPALLTALAEVQYRQGLPWEEEKTLNLAQANGVCYPRLHLALSDYFRFNSYYARAGREIQLAHQLDPYDPAIRRTWADTLPPEQRIDELKKYLSAKDTDVEALRRARYELAVLQNRQEDSANSCHLASAVTATDIDLEGIMFNAELVRAWGLDVYFNGHRARLQVDTGAGGLYVSREVAEHAGLKQIARSEASGIGDNGAQSGYTAYAGSIKIGGLEFKNCLVDVSDRKDVVGSDGLIGMNVFENFVVTLDFPWRKLRLGPLPPYPGTAAAPTELETTGSSSDSAAGAPHDRYVAPEMKSWMSIYRSGHFLIIPGALNNKQMDLFVIDSGAQLTNLSPQAAGAVSKVRSDDTMTIRGVSGTVKKVYRARDVAVRFGNLEQKMDGAVVFDTSNLSRNVGTEISGLLGMDTLHFLVVSIDYRDGLMNFEYSEDRGFQHIR